MVDRHRISCQSSFLARSHGSILPTLRASEHTGSDINATLPEEPSLDYLRIAISQRGDPEIERLGQGESIDAPSLKVTPVLLAVHGISLLCDTSHGRLRLIIPTNMRFDVFHLYHSWSHPGVNILSGIGRNKVYASELENVKLAHAVKSSGTTLPLSSTSPHHPVVASPRCM